MNTDWNGTPSRIQRKAGNAIVWCVSLVFGLGITGGALYIASGQIRPNTHAEAQLARLNAEAIRKHNEEVRARQIANQQRYQPAPMEEKNWIRSSEEAQRDAQTQRELQEWSRAQAEKQQERQTSFSDATYVPQGAKNVVPSTPIPRETYKIQVKTTRNRDCRQVCSTASRLLPILERQRRAPQLQNANGFAESQLRVLIEISGEKIAAKE